jgi:hypothetical protein
MFVASFVFLSACDSVEPDDGGGGDQELITLVSLVLTPQGGGAAETVEATFDEAGVLLSADTIELAGDTNYEAAIDLRNTLVNPPESIIPEVRDEEPEAHRFFYEAEGGVAGRVTAIDFDEDPNGDPLGTTFVLVASGGVPAAGQLRVVLRHYEEDATLPDDKRSDTALAPEVPGVVENDVNFVFPVQIN